MLVILVSCFLALIFSSKGISWFYRAVFIALAGVAFFYIYKDVLTMVGINEDEVFTEGLNLSHRARELSKATSGIDISNYSLGLQLFTFIYRPLFFDAPGVLGLIVSVENVFYLFISLRLLTLKGIRFLLTSPFLVKSAFFSFLTVSIALAQVSGNLGIAIRQKSQVMMLLLFVIICFMEDKQRARHQMRLAEQQRKKRAEELLNRQNETIRD
jgi:uncharacterized membrane protein